MGNFEPYGHTYCHTLTKVSLLINGSPALRSEPVVVCEDKQSRHQHAHPTISVIMRNSNITNKTTDNPCQGPLKCNLSNHR